LSKLKSRQIERIRGVVGRNVGFLSGPHQGTKAKAATKTGAGKKQVHSGPKRTQKAKEKTGARKTDASKQQAGAVMPKRTQAKRTKNGKARTDASSKQANSGPNRRKPQPGPLRPKQTQSKTDAEWQGKNGRRQQASGCTQAKTYASSTRVHSGPNGRKKNKAKPYASKQQEGPLSRRGMQAASGFKTDASNN
jgi:hypothetical protein